MTKNNNINNFLIPQVNRSFDSQKTSKTEKLENPKEFQELLKENIAPKKEDDVEFSQHALKRMEQRNLVMDNNEYIKLREGIEKLKNKGGQDSLIVTNKAAYIVDVANNKIVTAMDKNDMAENVFTKIDSTVFIN